VGSFRIWRLRLAPENLLKFGIAGLETDTIIAEFLNHNFFGERDNCGGLLAKMACISLPIEGVRTFVGQRLSADK